MDFAVPADHWGNIKESEKIAKLLYRARGRKKTVEHEGGGILFTQPLRSGRIWHKVDF